MRLAIAATPALAIPTLEWILTSNHSLKLVITRPDVAAGRGKVLQESEIGAWARRHDIKVLKPRRAVEIEDDLKGIDLVITMAYGVILPAEVLRVPKHGFINIHFSLLPAWRGAAPVQRGIENGDEYSGISIFQLDPGMDTGPIYFQEKVKIGERENSGELLGRLAILAPECIRQTLEKIEGGVLPRPQPIEGVSHAAKISKPETRVSWHLSAGVLSRRVRAFSPAPGCWTQWRSDRINIMRARELAAEVNLFAGEISIVDGLVIVGCGAQSALIIEEIQLAGKRAMPAKEWLNGARYKAGDFFD